MSMTNQPDQNRLLIRRVIISCVTLGGALVFILTKRDPGWQPFIAAGALAVLSLALSVSEIPGSDPVGYLAFAILVLAMFWEEGRPWAALAGFFLLVLRSLKNARIERIQGEEPVPPEGPD